jgi:regulator of ribonuclease activity B
MRDADIAACIFRHDARNLRLKRKLAERGIDWRNEYQTTCRFLAPDQRQAILLVEDLNRRGFRTVNSAPAGDKGCWSVEAQVQQSIDRTCSHEFTEEMVRSAASLSCIYHGWRALIRQDEGEEGAVA